MSVLIFLKRISDSYDSSESEEFRNAFFDTLFSSQGSIANRWFALQKAVALCSVGLSTTGFIIIPETFFMSTGIFTLLAQSWWR